MLKNYAKSYNWSAMTNRSGLVMLLVGLCLSGVAAFSWMISGVRAGVRASSSVTITQQTRNGPIRVWGSPASAYNSGDNIQFIGCEMIFHPDSIGSIVLCVGKDANGRTFQCLSKDPRVLPVVASIHADSFIDFTGNPNNLDATGTPNCTEIVVDNRSLWEPKNLYLSSTQ